MSRGSSSTPAATTTRVAVVIPTLNEERTIAGVIAALRRSRSVCHIYVVDGGSSDATCEIVRNLAAPEVILLHNPKRRQGAAVNMAAQQLLNEGIEVFVRCDAHAVYASDFVDRVVRTLEESGADSVVVPMDSVGDTPVQAAVAWVSNSPIGTGGSRHRAGRQSGWVDHGHHAAFRTKVFVDLGGYDESFSHNEDAEYDCRLRKAGGTIFLDADARITYWPRSSFRQLWRQYMAYGRGRARTVGRHPDTIRARQWLVPINLLLCAAGLLLAPIWLAALIWPAIYIGVLVVASAVFTLAKRSWRGLLTGPAALVMHTSWALGFMRQTAVEFIRTFQQLACGRRLRIASPNE